MPLVAVYGTLRVGEYNYERRLKGRTPLFRGVAQIPYRMYSCDEYPMLVPSEIACAITLEVFDVSDKKLAELDALEAPYGYHRESLSLAELGETVSIYVHPLPVPNGFELVLSGDWTETR